MTELVQLIEGLIKLPIELSKQIISNLDLKTTKSFLYNKQLKSIAIPHVFSRVSISNNESYLDIPEILDSTKDYDGFLKIPNVLKIKDYETFYQIIERYNVTPDIIIISKLIDDFDAFDQCCSEQDMKNPVCFKPFIEKCGVEMTSCLQLKNFSSKLFIYLKYEGKFYEEYDILQNNMLEDFQNIEYLDTRASDIYNFPSSVKNLSINEFNWNNDFKPKFDCGLSLKGLSIKDYFDESIVEILERTPNLKYLRLDPMSCFNPTILPIHFPSTLVTLFVANLDLSDSGSIALCHNLQKLELQGTLINWNLFTGYNFLQLKILKFDCSYYGYEYDFVFDDQVVESDVIFPESLETLTIKNHDKIKFKGSFTLPKYLKKLELDDINFKNDPWNVSNISDSISLKSCQCLQYLALRKVRFDWNLLTGDDFPYLKKLSLQFERRWRDISCHDVDIDIKFPECLKELIIDGDNLIRFCGSFLLPKNLRKLRLLKVKFKDSSWLIDLPIDLASLELNECSSTE